AGWDGSCSCAALPSQPLPPPERETGSAVGLQVVLLTAQAAPVEHPRRSRRAEKAQTQAPHRLSGRQPRSKRWGTAARLVAKPPQHVRRPRRDLPHQRAVALVGPSDVLSLARRPAGRPPGADSAPGEQPP